MVRTDLYELVIVDDCIECYKAAALLRTAALFFENASASRGEHSYSDHQNGVRQGGRYR